MKFKKHFSGVLLVLSIVVLLYLCIHLMMMMTTSESAKSTQQSNKPNSRNGPLRQESKMIVLPSGRQRPLTIELPFGGTVTGTRWAENIAIAKFPSGSELRGDVLYDENKQAILVRQGNETLATRPVAENMPIFMAKWCRRFDNIRREVPKIIKMEVVPMVFDDPQFYPLGQSQPFQRGQVNVEESTNQVHELGILNTAYQIRVSFEGLPAINVLVSASTLGLNFESVASDSYRADAEYVMASNLHGAMVRYGFAVLTPEGIVDQEDPWLVTEAWEHGCPWDESKLDPFIGDNLLSELVIPQKFDSELSSTEFLWLRRRTDPYAEGRERVMTAKAKRLEKESVLQKK